MHSNIVSTTQTSVCLYPPEADDVALLVNRLPLLLLGFSPPTPTLEPFYHLVFPPPPDVFLPHFLNYLD